MGNCNGGSRGNWRNNTRFEATDKFFGEIHQISNKRFKIKKQVLNNDEVIVFTNNVAFVKGNAVLVTDNNKAVYLKDWNIRKVTIEFENSLGDYQNTYAVKVNNKFFKEYSFKNSFSGMSFEKSSSFEALRRIAAAQEKQEKRIHIRSFY